MKLISSLSQRYFSHSNGQKEKFEIDSLSFMFEEHGIQFSGEIHFKILSRFSLRLRNWEVKLKRYDQKIFIVKWVGVDGFQKAYEKERIFLELLGRAFKFELLNIKKSFYYFFNFFKWFLNANDSHKISTK